MFKNKVSMPVVASSGGGGGYKIKKLTITENGLYDSELEAYKPVYVNVPQVAQGGSLKALLDATKSAHYLFANYKGTSVDELISYNDTSNVANMEHMFYSCTNLTSIPQLDTSSATNMNNMFYGCSELTSIPQLDTSSATNMNGMFNYCSNLTSIPQLDTSSATNMNSMFYGCSKLKSIPQLDTSKVTNMSYMFNNCSELTSIPQLDTSSATNMNGMFNYCTNLTSIGIYGFTCSIDISYTSLEHDALVAFLNQAGTAYNSSQKITMGSTKLALLSDEEKAIATNKGWTLA